VKLIVGGKSQKNVSSSWSGQPISEVVHVYNDPENDNEDSKHNHFSSKNLVKLDPKTRVFKFRNEAGDELTLTPAPTFNFNLNYDTLASSALNKESSAMAVLAGKEEEWEDYAAMTDCASW